jgi:hypothetical protein
MKNEKWEIGKWETKNGKLGNGKSEREMGNEK